MIDHSTPQPTPPTLHGPDGPAHPLWDRPRLAATRCDAVTITLGQDTATHAVTITVTDVQWLYELEETARVAAAALTIAHQTAPDPETP